MKAKVIGAMLALLLAVGVAGAETPYLLGWVRQLGSPGNDRAESVATDGSGNVYISGFTDGNLGGANAGGLDAFLVKYNSAGNLLWTRQFGTTAQETGGSVKVDGSGNAYVAGRTYGSLGGANAGGEDAFLVKYDSGGGLLWKRQLGTGAGDYAVSVDLDGSGNVYIAGGTMGSLGGPNTGGYDAFLAKYDSGGALVWKRQLGTGVGDYGRAVAVDGSGQHVYIAGMTYGNLSGANAGSLDAFLAKYNSDGAVLWKRQLGTGDNDDTFSVAVDGLGNAYMTGYTLGSLGGPNAGSYDAYLAKYDGAGGLLWTRQLGTGQADDALSVALDRSGNAYIAGRTWGALGETNAGGGDSMLAKYDSAGNLHWVCQLGTADFDGAYSVDLDGSGNVFIAGYTWGSLGGANAGGPEDAFLAKYVNPEPATPWVEAEAGGPYIIDVGQTMLLNGSLSIASDNITSYLWDLDGDGEYDDASGSNPPIGYDYLANSLGLTQGEHTVFLQVMTSQGLSAVDNATLLLAPEPATLSLLALGGLAMLRRRRR